MPTRGEGYRQTWVDHKYAILQDNYQRAIEEDERLRADRKEQLRLIDAEIKLLQQQVKAFSGTQPKTRSEGMDKLAKQLTDYELRFEKAFKDSLKIEIERFNAPSDLENVVAGAVARAVNPQVQNIVAKGDQRKAMDLILEGLRRDTVLQKALTATAEQRLDMANELAADIMTTMPGMPRAAILAVAAEVMQQGGDIRMSDLRPEDWETFKNDRARNVAINDENALRMAARQAGLPVPLVDADRNRINPDGTTWQSTTDTPQNQAVSAAVKSARSDIDGLLEDRTKLMERMRAPTEGQLQARAVEMGVDILADRERPKDKRGLIMFLGRDAVDYLKTNDPDADATKAGDVARQIYDMMKGGTLSQKDVLATAGRYAGKNEDLRDDIMVRVMARMLRAQAEVAPDPKAVTEGKADAKEEAIKAEDAAQQAELDANQAHIDQAKSGLKEAAVVEEATAQPELAMSDRSPMFTGSAETIAGLPLNERQKEMASLIMSEFKKAGLPEAAAYAAIANAMAESTLDPHADTKETEAYKRWVAAGRPDPKGPDFNEDTMLAEDSVGLFQLNAAPTAMGAGMSDEARMDPVENIRTMISAIKGSQGRRFLAESQSGVRSIGELTAMFTEDLEKPQDADIKGRERGAMADQWFGVGTVVPVVEPPPRPTLGPEPAPPAPAVPEAQLSTEELADLGSPLTVDVGLTQQKRADAIQKHAAATTHYQNMRREITNLPMYAQLPHKARLADAWQNVVNQQARIDAIDSAVTPAALAGAPPVQAPAPGMSVPTGPETTLLAPQPEPLPAVSDRQVVPVDDIFAERIL